jgi:integrase
VLLYLQQHAPNLKNFIDLRGALALCQPWYAGQPITALADVARRYATDNAKTLSPATVRNRMAYLRAACRWAWKHHNVGDHDPAERMVLPRVKNERHIYIERGAVLQLARAIHNHDARACVLVAYYSGMRLGEILRAKRTPGGWLLADTKNGQRRLVPVHPAVAHIARRWPLKVASRTVQGQFARAAAALGYTDLHFHDLRHSAASGMINAGVDLYTVGGVLGHKSSQSTQRYAHLKTASLQSAIAKIGARNAKRFQP